MPGLFDRVKDLVDIRQYIELETGGQARRAGKAWRLNPCPFCGHNDCFTIHDKDGFYKCFSCAVGGDVIEFEQAYRHLSSPLEAAKSIAAKRGIPVLDGEDGGVRVAREPDVGGQGSGVKESGVKKDGQGEDRTKVGLKIDPGRACEVRLVAAMYYHERLLADQRAWAYQTEKRKHSPEILKRLRVGLGGGNLIGHCKGKGVSVEELAAVGLVQSHKGGWRAVVANGVFVYPHMVGDRIVFFSLKDPEKKRPWQLKKEFAPEGWICYGQDAMEQDDLVVIVEGENDRISVMDLGGCEACMATIASYNEPAILARLKGAAKGHKWYLAFDNDPAPDGKAEGAGARYTRTYANALLEAGGDVWVIRIEPGEGGGKSDIDDVLRGAEDPRTEMGRLLEEAEHVTAAIPEPAVGEPWAKGQGAGGGGGQGSEGGRSDPYEFKSFEVLGELQDERILFWSRVNERLYSVALRDLNLDKLVQVGGIEVAAKVARSMKEAFPEQVLFGAVKKRIIVQAGNRQLWNPEYLGQGIHGLEDRLVIVVGGRAWVWDGQTLAQWEHPVIDGRLVDWRKGFDWVDMDKVAELLESMDGPAGTKILDELLNLFFQWGFAGKLDVWLIVGWYLAQYLQSMWAWRPHLWLTGTAGSGKTLMNELMGAIGGRLALRCEGQTLTEPGLRQSIGCDSVLVAIDEIEKSEHREQIIYYIRSAGRGGVTRKGSASQKALEAKIRHMVFLSSIERGIYRAAENSRYLTIETKKSSDCQPKVPSTKEADELRAKIVAYCLWAAFRARALMDGIGKIGDADPRFVESLSVAMAMVAVSSAESQETLTRLLTEYLEGWRARFEGGILEDEEKLVEDILMAQVRLPEETEGELRTNGFETSKTVYVVRMVGQLLEKRGLMPEEAKKVLEAHGVKAVDGDGKSGGGLFLHPDTVVKALLHRTQWQGLNIRDMLLRIAGAEARQLRLGGAPVRGVVVPWVVFGL